MCEVRSREKRARTKKKKYNGQQQKEMDYHEPHPAPNEKTQPIQWTERPTGALVAVNSLWPLTLEPYLVHKESIRVIHY
jgi:hypothetical protein